VGEPREYRAARSVVIGTRIVGGLGVLGSLAMLGALFWIEAPSLADQIAAVGAAAGGLALATWGLRRAARLARRRVRVASDALYCIDPATHDVRIAWNEVRALRERAFLNRIDVVTVGDAFRIALEYELERFEELLASVVERTPEAQPARPLPAAFAARLSGLNLLALLALVGIGGASALAAWLTGEFRMLLAALGLLALLPVLLSHQLRRVELDGLELRGVRLWRPLRLPLAELREPRLELREAGNNQKELDVTVESAGGKRHSVRPAGCDAIALFRTLSSAVATARRPGPS
jgi:hypothetical protein